MNIRALSQSRVVVVGDLILDQWVYGRIERISPEAPVPVFLEETQVDTPGGAGHVQANLKALGCWSMLFTREGTIPIKRRYLTERHQQVFRSDKEDCTPISGDRVKRIMVGLASISPKPDVLVISDYGKGVCTPYLCRSVLDWAEDKQIPVVVDPKGTDWTKYRGAKVITPNAKEWGEVIFHPESARILVTRGAEGMTLLGAVENHGTVQYRENHFKAVARSVADVTGAGDTVVAVLAAALGAGVELVDAVKLANAAAGVVVGKSFTATCTIEELEAAHELSPLS